jgi:GNAT superfamily N-acetyltransferase
MEYLPVVMLRSTLADLPPADLPAGYRMRLFRDGDQAAWVRIQQAAERFEKISEQTFEQQFGFDLPAMRRRGLFLVAPDGQDVGALTAWYQRRLHGRKWGRIHWVAIVPEHQGKGLSKPMTAFALRLMRRLGHRRAMLTTQTPRIPAIKTYLDLGFVPDMTMTNAEHAWELVKEVVKHCGLGNG